MPTKQNSHSKLVRYTATVRIIFGLIWAIDAFFKWQPAFANSYLDIVSGAAQNQPSWLQPWFHFWISLISSNPHLFAILTAIIETLIALSLVFGFGRRLAYILSVIFSLIIWSVAEGFGGPYGPTSTDVGAALIYAIVFVALYGLEHLTSPSVLVLDAHIAKKFPWWTIIANP